MVGVAIESHPDDVRSLAAKHDLPFPTVLGPPELAVAFGDLVAVPTVFVFDRGGDLVKTFFGAPPELKQELADLVAKLVANDGKQVR